MRRIYANNIQRVDVPNNITEVKIRYDQVKNLARYRSFCRCGILFVCNLRIIAYVFLIMLTNIMVIYALIFLSTLSINSSLLRHKFNFGTFFLDDLDIFRGQIASEPTQWRWCWVLWSYYISAPLCFASIPVLILCYYIRATETVSKLLHPLYPNPKQRRTCSPRHKTPNHQCRVF